MPILSVVRRRALAPAAAVVLPAYLCACFRYVPAASDRLPGPRTEVRLRLADPIRVPLGEVALEDVVGMEGTVARATADSLEVWARWLYPRVGRKRDALGATFSVPKENVARIEQYRLSAGLTALGLVAVGAVTVGFLRAMGLVKIGGSSGDVPPDNMMLWGAGFKP